MARRRLTSTKAIRATFSSRVLEDASNPYPKGHLLTKRIDASLRRLGVHVTAFGNWRDVGYAIDCDVDGHRVYLFVSFIGESPRDWMLGCTSDAGILARLLGRGDDDQIAKLAQLVDRALHGDDEIADIRWYVERGWAGTGDEPWREHP